MILMGAAILSGVVTGAALAHRTVRAMDRDRHAGGCVQWFESPIAPPPAAPDADDHRSPGPPDEHATG